MESLEEFPQDKAFWGGDRANTEEVIPVHTLH